VNPDPAVHTSRVSADLKNPNGVINTECNFCHNNTTTVTNPKFQLMSTHFTYDGSGQKMNCSVCHDIHGSTNLYSIRTIIYWNTSAYPITFTSITAASFVNAEGRGLCQVCHRNTGRFKKGTLNENRHATGTCTNECHKHDNKGGAFSIGGGGCNGCHGYPPVPASFIQGRADAGPYKKTYGGFQNYTDAKPESYTGGGGVHLNHVATYAKASDTDPWKHCAVCHSGGNISSQPGHTMSSPSEPPKITLDFDPRFKFNASLQVIYSGASMQTPPYKRGSCVNIACHFQPTPKWDQIN
jgi:hypothetical protein